MISDQELQPILMRPDLPQIADRINARLQAEQVARQKFRHELSPSVKAEFIAGQVVMHSPAKAKHLRATDNMVNLLRNFVFLRKLGEVFTEKALICLTRNDYEPDVCFFRTEKATKFDGETMRFPAADFIVEVLSDSTESRDRGVKMEDYAAHQTGEYWIVDCDEETIEQYLLSDDQTTYRLARKISESEIESKIVTGFRIPVQAIFDTALNHTVLQNMLTQSPDFP